MNTLTESTEYKTVSGTKLHKLVKDSPTAGALALYLATRDRIRGFTDIKRLNMDLQRNPNVKTNIDEKESEAFFGALEKEGYGKIVRSKALGGRARFLWRYNMTKVAGAIIDAKDIMVQELPLSMQRLKDANRKSRHLTLVKEAIQAKEVVPAIPVVEIEQKVIVPETLNINGKEYVQMTKEEYTKLQKIKELFSNIK